VFARAAGCGFVSFLTEYHILGGEPSDFNQELTGGGALNAPVKQAPFAPRSAFGLAGRRAEILFAPFFPSAFLAPAFLGGKVEIVVVHRILQVE
jgi:hypothetical protein